MAERASHARSASRSASAQRIDLPAARLRLAGLTVLAAMLSATCLWSLVAEPGGRYAAPGSFRHFALLCGLVLFGLGVPVLLRELLRRGPVVSVDHEGLFDRRLSTDRIPWRAIVAVDEVGIGNQGFLRLNVQPELADGLPWTRRGRWHARLNGRYGGGYWVAAQGVRGGMPALRDALAQIRDERR